jgi:16S rRNA (uracil1498-N3)-methyltransferase
MRKDHTLPRLYVPATLSQGASCDLPREQAHYLGTVLRKSVNDAVRVFNAKDGEWRAEITAINKRAVTLSLVEQLRQPEPSPDITLLFAPIRKHRMAFVIEKATELGVTTLQPVITARTQTSRFNVEKAQAQAVEAAEQCERLDVPEVRAAMPLLDLLSGWDETPILFADESGGAAIGQVAGVPPITLLVGPEGGFTDAERENLHAINCVTPVSLGPRILRADTAALVMLAVMQG